jgi:hypothetical protein
MDGDGYEPDSYEPDSYDHARPGPPCDEDVWESWRRTGLTVLVLLGTRERIDPEEVTYRSASDEALAGYIRHMEAELYGSVSDMVMDALIFLRCWLRDHQGPPPPMLRRAFLVLLAVLRAIARQPGQPGRPDDPSLRVPSAPLVRARAILTAAPPSSSRASVLAGVPA